MVLRLIFDKQSRNYWRRTEVASRTP